MWATEEESRPGESASRSVNMIGGVLSVIAFFSVWLVAIATHGWLVGGALGWVVGLFAAAIVAHYWWTLAIVAGLIYVLLAG